MVGLNFKDFLDLEKGDNILDKSKLNWKRDLHGIKIPHNVIMIKYANNVRYLLK